MPRIQVVPRATLAAAALLFAACYGRKKGFENWNANVPIDHFKTVATIAGGTSRQEIRMMVTVRQDLKKAGVNAVPASGRWDTVAEALGGICSPGAEQPVDGVVVVHYDHLVLYDCQTNKAAFEIQGTGEQGITDMTQRLVKYLKRKPAE
jgi:ABC-type transport system substrate-binding protein